MQNLIRSFFFLLLLSAALWARAETPAQAAQRQLSQNIDTVLTISRDNRLSDREKVNRIEQYADRYLDYERLSALAVGLPWRQFSPAQKTAFIGAFKDMIIRLYARSALMGAADAKVSVLPKTISNGTNRIDVFTEIRSKAGKTYTVAYQTYRSGNVYKVYNIRVEGASLVTVYRNQFNELIAQKGIDGTIAFMRQKGLEKVDAFPKK